MPAYKDKNSTWFCKFYYKDWQGQRQQEYKRGFKREKDAKKYEREFLDKAHADCTMSFKSLYEIYMADMEPRLKPTTFENKKVLIELKILEYFKDMPINEIEPATIRKWQTELLSQGYKPTYLKTIHNQLTAMFNYAVKFYKLQSNPARLCGSMGKKNAEAMQIWTIAEFNEFIKSLENKPSSKVAFEILFWTGMRSGELLALTLNDIDFESKTISITKNYAVVNKVSMIMEPKTPKSKRKVAVNDTLLESISAYVKKLYDYQPHERLFPFTKSLLNIEMDRCCKKTGVKKIRVHDLRHSHASLLIELGFSPLLIAERLGHERIQTTLETYSHLYPNKQVEVAEQLESITRKTTK